MKYIYEVIIYKQKFCNSTNNLPDSLAFNSSIACSRIGLHNDCFLYNGTTEMGMFDSGAVAQQKQWLYNEGKYTMVGGEACDSNSIQGCSYAASQIQRERFTHLNQDFSDVPVH